VGNAAKAIEFFAILGFRKQHVTIVNTKCKVVVAPPPQGADGAFTLYEDENDGYAYEKGVYATIAISWSQASQTLTIGERKGSFTGMLQSRTFKIVFVDASKGAGIAPTSKVDVTVPYNGQALTVHPR
jgi:alpha-glucosidase (family GH31 glycosyl hydrolase)